MVDVCERGSFIVTDAVIADKEITLTQAATDHPFTSYWSFNADYCDMTISRVIGTELEDFVTYDETL